MAVHLQKMVNQLRAIEDREEQNKVANSIIAVMGNLHRICAMCQIFSINYGISSLSFAEFDLDVDSPYETPSKEKLEERPDPLKISSKPS